METSNPTTPLQPGQRAPDFHLPAVNHDGSIALSDYLGKHSLLLALFRGLYCPFCRRSIAELGATSEKLEGLGVRTLAVVATPAANARLYYRFRPTKVLLAADPELETHRSFGIPKEEVTPDLLDAFDSVKINPTGELERPQLVAVASQELNQMDGFEPNESDREDQARQFPQLDGQFLIDRAGIVRWSNIECADEGLGGLGRFPAREVLLSTARELNLV